MSEGKVQYDRKTMPSGAIMKNADEQNIHWKIMIWVTMPGDNMILV